MTKLVLYCDLLKEQKFYDTYVHFGLGIRSWVWFNSAYKCSLCKNLLISGQGSDMVLGFETKVCLRLHTDAFSPIQESQKLT